MMRLQVIRLLIAVFGVSLSMAGCGDGRFLSQSGFPSTCTPDALGNIPVGCVATNNNNNNGNTNNNGNGNNNNNTNSNSNGNTNGNGTTGTVPTGNICEIAPSRCTSGGSGAVSAQAVHRYYADATGDVSYSKDSQLGLLLPWYRYEKVAFKTLPASSPGNLGLYLLYDPMAERSMMVTSYMPLTRYEMIGKYQVVEHLGSCNYSQQSGQVALQALWSPRDFQGNQTVVYTTDSNEANQLRQSYGYFLQGTLCYTVQ